MSAVPEKCPNHFRLKLTSRFGNLVLIFLIAMVVVCGAKPSSVEADLVYTSRAAYDAATTGNTLIDFEGFTGGPSFFSSYSSGGATFTANSGNLWGADSGWYGNASDAMTIQAGSPNEFMVTFPSPFSAVGFDLFTFSSPDLITIATSSGHTTSVMATGGSYTFIGMTCDAPFTSVTITGTNQNFGIDNFDFGESAVPEPGSFVIVTLCCLVGLKRRRIA